MTNTALIALLVGPAAMAQQKDSGSPVLEEVIISSDRPNSYSADLVQAGSFHGAKQLDTPLTINVIPEEMLVSQQVSNLLDALRNTAGVTESQISPIVYSNLNIRGISVDNRGNYRLNGSLPIANFITQPVEAFQRIEALKGASALYYGFTSPAGIINMAMKRPTQEFTEEVDQFDDSHGSMGVHADAGGTVGMFGYRVNALDSTMDTGITYVTGHRAYITGAFDLKPTDDLTISLDGIHNQQHIVEPANIKVIAPASTVTNLYPTVALPPLLDPKVNLGAPWGYNTAVEDNILGHIQYKINDQWTLSADAGNSVNTRLRWFGSFSLVGLNQVGQDWNGAGTLGTSANNARYENTNYRGELAGTFYTGPILHEVLFGVTENKRDLTQMPTSTTNPCGTAASCPQNYFNPVVVPQNVFGISGTPQTSRIFDLGEYIFDRIKYDDWIQVLIGGRNAEYHQYTIGTTVGSVHSYPLSYSYGVVLKPVSWVSLYGDYMQGLETTAGAPQTVTNPGVQLPPEESEQREAGVKVEITKGLLLQTAYFNIKRGAAYTNGANTYVLDGRQQYKGEEVSLTGEVTKDLSLYVSAQNLDAKQISGSPTIVTVSKGVTTVSPTIVGKVPDGTPQITWSFAGEYHASDFVPGLSFTFGAYYTDKRAVNAADQAWVPAYTTYDLGASYVMEVKDHPVTLRINAMNITDARYWVGSGALNLSESAPATIKFSLATLF